MSEQDKIPMAKGIGKGPEKGVTITIAFPEGKPIVTAKAPGIVTVVGEHKKTAQDAARQVRLPK